MKNTTTIEKIEAGEEGYKAFLFTDTYETTLGFLRHPDNEVTIHTTGIIKLDEAAQQTLSDLLANK